MAHAWKEKLAEAQTRLKGVKLKELFALGRSIKGKLLFWLLLISLVPMAVIALFSWRQSASALQRQSFENLETTLAFQKQALQQYFSEQEKTLQSVADTMHILQEEAYARLTAVRDLYKKQIGDYFQMRYQNVQSFSSNPQQQEVFLKLIRDKGAAQSLSDDMFSYMKGWMAQRDFYSLILLNPAGEVLYSTDSAVPVGAAVKEGSPEANALQKGMQETAFIDYGLSSFFEGKPVAYFAAPLVDEDRLEGVFLFRLKDNALDDIMESAFGLDGEGGEAYMVGVDGMFRSNSVYFEEPTVANPAYIVDTESVFYALSGESGVETTVNYRGDYVLSSYTSVEIFGTTWVLLVETEQAAAMAPKAQGAKNDHLAELAKTYGFPDFYLLNPDGYIFYTVAHQPDYLTNILTGPYAKSDLAETVGEVMKTGQMAVSDYSLYAAAGDRPAAFLAAPIKEKIKDEEKIVLIAAIQVPIDQINAVMNIRSQFEKNSAHQFKDTATAETYLVGPDKLWRSEAADAKKYGVSSTLLNPKVKTDTKAVQEALKGKDSTEVTVNGAGEDVLSSWSQFKYKDLTWAIISEANYDAVHQPVTNLLKIIGATVLAAAVLIAVVSLLVSGGVTRQVSEITTVMTKVEQGDYSDRVRVTSQDELGRLAQSFNSMTGTIQNLIQTRQEEHDKLNNSIIQLLEEFTVLADGDLTIRATVTDDVIGTLADSINLMLDNLSQAFRRIKDSAEQVGSTANVLSSSTGELAEQNNAQSKMINEAVEKIGVLTEEIRKAADKAVRSAGSSKESSHVAEDGAAAVRETSQAMEAIRSNVQNTARAIKRLGESSQEISDFARTINEISDRTSILALNASIQAAAAGEEGRGFAVVAEEIQRLAERAAVSTRQIETLIRNILGEITEAGVSMDASIQEVVQGTKLSQNALAKLEEITSRSNEVAELIEDVAAVSKEQAGTTAELAGKMKDIGGISLETAQETMGASISMREMAAMGEDMLQAVAAFKIEADAKKKA